jgi:hypothetical protein
MLRPLGLDILGFLLPICGGASAFLAGRSLRRLPRAAQIVLVALCVGLVGVAGLPLLRSIPDDVARMLSLLGGATVLLSGVALFLLGVVWSVPGRSLSSGFLAALAALAGCLLLIESGGRLWWRFCAPQMWQRSADTKGHLQQSSAVSCSPAAAVMLLHHHGIDASEGEMAYLSGTSLFGTDAHGMARALARKGYPHGMTALAQRTDYEARLRRGGPFLAHVQQSLTGHALLVVEMSKEHVEVLDPLDGRGRRMSRADFERVWDGMAISMNP